jgi:hypothetical protein
LANVLKNLIYQIKSAIYYHFCYAAAIFLYREIYKIS